MVLSHSYKGTRYFVGECVRVKPHEEEAAKNGKSEFVAKILAFRKTKNDVEAKLNWYYWPAETKYINVKSCGEKEVYESLLRKFYSVRTFISKCKVHRLSEYCKLPVVTVEDFYCRFRVNDSEQLELAGGGPTGRIPVYCICGQMYNPDRSMIKCDICEERFHYDCIGGTPEEMKNVSYYACEECKNQEKRRKVIRSNYESFESAMVPLTREQKLELQAIFSLPESDDILVKHKGTNIAITQKIFFCLKPNEWLNDEVINVYFGLLMERQEREPDNFLKCLFSCTFFCPKVKLLCERHNYEGLRKSWTNYINISEYDKIFVPINHSNNHWSLAVINKADKKYMHIDSLESTCATQVMENLSLYYKEQVKHETGKVIDADWEFVEVKDCPRQTNGYDCGVFMIKYADFHSRDMPLVFKEADMKYFRRRTAYEVLKLRAD